MIIEGNSYNLVLNKKINFEDRTAGFFINDYEKEKIKFNIFLQNGVNIQNKLTKEIFLPSDVSFDQNGGVKSVFKVKEKIFALVSNKKINCAYASIYEREKQKNIFTTNCLPDIKNVDFNGLGGAVVEKDNFIFISIGAPEWDSREISSLAQNKDFLYGKIIKIEKKYFSDSLNEKPLIDIFTYGHKNPQGLTTSKEFFSIEHGPQGGDEINLIQRNKNFGWPKVSYGTEYNNGRSYDRYDKNFQNRCLLFCPQ